MKNGAETSAPLVDRALLAQPLRMSAGWYIGSGCNSQRRPSIRSWDWMLWNVIGASGFPDAKFGSRFCRSPERALPTLR